MFFCVSIIIQNTLVNLQFYSYLFIFIFFQIAFHYQSEELSVPAWSVVSTDIQFGWSELEFPDAENKTTLEYFYWTVPLSFIYMRRASRL